MRRRIALLVVGVTTFVLLAAVVPLGLLVRHAVYTDATNRLQQEANSIANFLRGDFAQKTEQQITSYLAGLSKKRTACVELANGDVIGTVPPGGLNAVPAVDQPQPGGDGDGPPGGGGGTQPSTTNYRGGKLAQLPVLGGRESEGFAIVRVYASDDELYSGANGWWLLIGGCSLALVVLGAGAAELLTRRLVRPLVRTADTAHRMSSGDVTARAPTDGPREIAEVGVALNLLGDRIDELIAEERETVADMSHRLRTPLTALRLDAEALQDPADAERVGNHVSELERMLTAVIRAARRPEREGRLPSCDATAVVGERVAFWSALTEDQQRPSAVTLPAEPLVVRASAGDLGAAVDALLENVVAHTPEGTAFGVRLAAVPTGARLEVSDDGLGLPADEPVRGRSDRGSSGLGLDIARRCAEASGGSMTLGSTPSGGALITLELHAP